MMPISRTPGPPTSRSSTTEGWYAKAHYNLALTYHRRGQLDEACAEYERTLEIEPDYFDALNNLAVLRCAQGEVRTAVGLLERACAAEPTRAQGQMNLGRLHLQCRDFAAAARCFAEARRLLDGRAEPLYWLGWVALEEGRPREAAEQLRAVLAAEPEHSGARLLLARCLIETGDLEAAHSSVRHVLAREPANARAHNLAGVIAHKAGLRDEAAASFERAIEHSPEYAAAYKNLGTVRSEQGDYAGAAVAYRRYIRLETDPDERRRTEVLAQRIEHFYMGASQPGSTEVER